MIISGVVSFLLIGLTFLSLIGFMGSVFTIIWSFIKIMFFSGILLIVFSCFLFKKKKWAWKASTVLTFLLILIDTSLSVQYLQEGGIMRYELWGFKIQLLLYFLHLPPLLLLLLDRKNFWKIAT